MLDNIRITEAYESMYSENVETVDEGIGSAIGGILLNGAKKAATRTLSKTATTVKNSKIGRKIGSAITKTKGNVTAVKQSASTTSRNFSSSKGIMSRLKSEKAKLATLRKGSSAYGKQLARVKRLERVAAGSMVKTAGSAFKTLGRGIKVIAPTGGLILAGLSIVGSTAWMVYRKVSAAAAETISAILDDGKIKTHFLGESENISNSLMNFIHSKVSQQDKDEIFSIYLEGAKAQCNEVDVSQISDEDKESIIADMIKIATNGILPTDDDKTIEEKINKNLSNSSDITADMVKEPKKSDNQQSDEENKIIDNPSLVHKMFKKAGI